VPCVSGIVNSNHFYRTLFVSIFLDQIHDELNKRMKSELERVLFEEQEQKNRYLEKELAELRANYEELNESLKKRKICSIM
jgi:hypothetical protein